MILTLAKVGVRACLVLTVLSLAFFAQSAQAGLLPFEKKDSDSDFSVLAGVSGSYDFASDVLTLTGTSASLDEGPGSGNDYTGFGALMSLTAEIANDGSIFDVGSFELKYLGPPSSTLAVAYGLSASDVMLSGHVVEVLLESSSTMQVAVEITGGNSGLVDLFTDPSIPWVGLKVTVPGADLPSNFDSDTGSYALVSQTTIDIVGPIPEPSSVVLGLAGTFLALVGRSKGDDLT